MGGDRAVRLAIAVPTYNEAANLEGLIAGIHEQLADVPDVECRVLVVDDDSPDGTGVLADALAERYRSAAFEVGVLHRPAKAGLASAYVAAFGELIDQGFDHVMEMDADLSHDPRHLPAMIAEARHADLVVGSRYVAGGGTPDWSPLRRLLSRGGNRYARLLLGPRLTDYTGGFNLYAADLLKRVDPGAIRAQGYGFQIELKHAALACCDEAVEVPIVFVDRRHGTSKIPKSTIFEVIRLVPRLRFATRQRPVRPPTPHPFS